MLVRAVSSLTGFYTSWLRRWRRWRLCWISWCSVSWQLPSTPGGNFEGTSARLNPGCGCTAICSQSRCTSNDLLMFTTLVLKAFLEYSLQCVLVKRLRPDWLLEISVSLLYRYGKLSVVGGKAWDHSFVWPPVQGQLPKLLAWLNGKEGSVRASPHVRGR